MTIIYNIDEHSGIINETNNPEIHHKECLQDLEHFKDFVDNESKDAEIELNYYLSKEKAISSLINKLEDKLNILKNIKEVINNNIDKKINKIEEYINRVKDNPPVFKYEGYRLHKPYLDKDIHKFLNIKQFKDFYITLVTSRIG